MRITSLQLSWGCVGWQIEKSFPSAKLLNSQEINSFLLSNSVKKCMVLSANMFATCLQTKNILKSVNEQFTKDIFSFLILVSFANCLYPLLNFWSKFEWSNIYILFYLLYSVYRKVLAWSVCFPFPAPLVTQKRHAVATVLFSFQFVTLEQALEEGFGEKNAFPFWSYPPSPSERLITDHSVRCSPGIVCRSKLP